METLKIGNYSCTGFDELTNISINPFFTVENIAQDMVRKATLRWEEIQVEKATTEQLQKAKKMIDDELNKRLSYDTRNE